MSLKILWFSVDFNFFFVLVLFHFIYLLVLQHIIVKHLVHTNLASRCIWNITVNRSRKVYGRSWHSMFCGPTWIPLPIFVNKVLSNTVVPIYLQMVYGCFCATRAELSSCNRDSVAGKAKRIYYLPFIEKVCWPLVL